VILSIFLQLDEAVFYGKSQRQDTGAQVNMVLVIIIFKCYCFIIFYKNKKTHLLDFAAYTVKE